MTAGRRHPYKCNEMQCQKCEKQLQPDEPVWRQQESLAPEKWRAIWGWRLITVCSNCKSESTFSEENDCWPRALTSPCDGCGRPLTIEGRFRRRCKHWACSEKCRRKAARLRKRAVTAKRRQRDCPVCGETFTPRRNDAITCSFPTKHPTNNRRVPQQRHRRFPAMLAGPPPSRVILKAALVSVFRQPHQRKPAN